MPQNRKQRLFYKNGQLSSATGSGQSATLFSASNTSLAERSAETILLAANSQNSIINSSSRNNIQYLSYTAYGHGHTDLTLGYTGQRYDRPTNCYHLGNGYRAFNPRIMRFLSPDSLSPFGNRTLNAYAYCMGDPINRHDPSGHTWESIMASLRKPKIHYLAKARAAIADNPKLDKYSIIADDPNVTIDKLKAIYKISKAEKILEQHRRTALGNLTTTGSEAYRNDKTSKLDYASLLEGGDNLNYIMTMSKLSKYSGMLDNFVSSSHEQPHHPSAAIRASSSPQAERTEIRSTWVTFED